MMDIDHRPTILIVDDVPLNIQVLAQTLKQSYRVLIATSGAKALEVASSSMPDLVLLDVMMPEMDGYEVCRRLKKKEETHDIPVIFITAKDEEDDEEYGLSLGAVDYISKPFSLAIVKARVNTQLCLKRKSDELNRLSMQDGLTGIANRRAFEDVLEREWRRMARVGGELSLLMVDVDYFKQYNDTYGHLLGDDCIKLIASIISARFRRSCDFVARFGGEEFVVLMSETDAQTASTMSEKLRNAIADKKIAHTGSLIGDWLTVSIGCATLSPQGRGDGAAQTLIDIADRYLYEAKEEGRNRSCCMFS